MVTRYHLQTAPDRPFVIVALCRACETREQRPHRTMTGTAPRGLICEQCGFDAATGETLTVAALLDDLVAVVDRQRPNLPAEWQADFDDAYNWLLEYDGQLFTDGHTVLLPSDSDPQWYSVNGVCQCTAHQFKANARRDQVCKHRLRGRLVLRAYEHRLQVHAAAHRALVEARAAEAQAEVDALYA